MVKGMKDKYEYITIYVDDLLIASEEPHQIIQDLKEKFKLKIKGDGLLEYHLGCDYKLDKDGTLLAQPTKYINKILDSYKKMFRKENFINGKSPLEKNDHPELDSSELCNKERITKYMSMMGQLQWSITLGRYDILAQVMSMSRFRLAPKIGQLERMKRLYGYLAKTKHYAIRYRTKEPDYSHLPKQEYEWSRTVNGNVKEEIPKDIPKPQGKRVISTTFLDANLLHDIVACKSVTAVLHFVNTTPTDWFLKRQTTVETAAYGSEFVAAKTASEQIMDLKNTLRYLGVPIMNKAFMSGANKFVVMSSTIPQSILNQRHNMLSYHRVREAIAAKILEFHGYSSSQNRSDILGKHWHYMKVKDTVRELFDDQGDIVPVKPD